MKEKEYMHWMEGIRPDYIEEAANWNHAGHRHTITMQRMTAVVTASAACVAVCAGAFIYNGRKLPTGEQGDIQPAACNLAGGTDTLVPLVPDTPNMMNSYMQGLYLRGGNDWYVNGMHLWLENNTGYIESIPADSRLAQFCQDGTVLTDGTSTYYQRTGESTLYRAESDGTLTEFFTVPEENVQFSALRALGDNWYYAVYQYENGAQNACYFRQGTDTVDPADRTWVWMQTGMEGENSSRFYAFDTVGASCIVNAERNVILEGGVTYVFAEDSLNAIPLCVHDGLLYYVTTPKDPENGKEAIRLWSVDAAGTQSVTTMCEDGSLLQTTVSEAGNIYLLIQTDDRIELMQVANYTFGQDFPIWQTTDSVLMDSLTRDFAGDEWHLATAAAGSDDCVLVCYPTNTEDGTLFTEVRTPIGMYRADDAYYINTYDYGAAQHPGNDQPPEGTQAAETNFLGGVGELVPCVCGERVVFFDDTRIWNITNGWYADRLTGKMYDISTELLSKYGVEDILTNYCAGEHTLLSDGRDIFFAENNTCYRTDSRDENRTEFLTIAEGERFTGIRYLVPDVYEVQTIGWDETGAPYYGTIIYNETTGEIKNYNNYLDGQTGQEWGACADGTYAAAFYAEDGTTKLVRFLADGTQITYDQNDMNPNWFSPCWYVFFDTIYTVDFQTIDGQLCQCYAKIDLETGERKDLFTVPTQHPGVIRMMSNGDTCFIDPQMNQLTLWTAGNDEPRVCDIPSVGDKAREYLISTGYHLFESKHSLYITIPDIENNEVMLAEIDIDSFEITQLFKYAEPVETPAFTTTTTTTPENGTTVTTVNTTANIPAGSNLFGGAGTLRPMGSEGWLYEDDEYWYVFAENIRISKNADTAGNTVMESICRLPGCAHISTECTWARLQNNANDDARDGMRTDGRDLYYFRGNRLYSLAQDGTETQLFEFTELPGGYAVDTSKYFYGDLCRISNDKILVTVLAEVYVDGIEQLCNAAYVCDLRTGSILLVNPNDVPGQKIYLETSEFATDGNGGLWFLTNDDNCIIQVDTETGIWTKLPVPEDHYLVQISREVVNGKIYVNDLNMNGCCYDIASKTLKVVSEATDMRFEKRFIMFGGEMCRLTEEYDGNGDKLLMLRGMETGKEIKLCSGFDNALIEFVAEDFILMRSNNNTEAEIFTGQYVFHAHV